MLHQDIKNVELTLCLIGTKQFWLCYIGKQGIMINLVSK